MLLFLKSYSPHHCVGFLFYAWIPPLPRPRPRPPGLSPPHHTTLITATLITSHSSQHNYTTYHISLITHPSSLHHLSPTPLFTSSHSPLITSHSSHHSSLHHFSHLTHHTHLSHHSSLGRGCLSRGRRSTQSLQDKLRRAWPPLGRN